jgi:hypothetical protein
VRAKLLIKRQQEQQPLACGHVLPAQHRLASWQLLF